MREHIFTERFKTLLVSSVDKYLSADDETSNVLKRSVKICSLTFWLIALY